MDLIFSTFPVFCSSTLSNKYSSLSLPFVIKNTSEEFRVVLIPILFIFLFVTYTFCGKLNRSPVDEVEIAIFVPTVGIVKVTCWLFVKGWFSIYIDCVGTFLVTVELPNWKVREFVIPLVVPSPTDWFGLKYTLLLTLESKLSIFLEIVNESGIKFICVVAVWDNPVDPLFTLSILRFLNTSNTYSISEFIAILLPTDTDDGSWVT